MVAEVFHLYFYKCNPLARGYSNSKRIQSWTTNQHSGCAPPHNAQLRFVRCLCQSVCSHLQPTLNHQLFRSLGMRHSYRQLWAMLNQPFRHVQLEAWQTSVVKPCSNKLQFAGFIYSKKRTNNASPFPMQLHSLSSHTYCYHNKQCLISVINFGWRDPYHIEHLHGKKTFDVKIYS